MTSPDDPTSENDTPASSVTEGMKSAFDAGHEGVKDTPLFTPDALDIYVNKATMEVYLFHLATVDYEGFEQLEYSPMDYTVTVRYKDKTVQDLGVKIQWLVRPYFARAKVINIVQTKDGESINGTVIPIVHKVKE